MGDPSQGGTGQRVTEGHRGELCMLADSRNQPGLQDGPGVSGVPAAPAPSGVRA